MRHSDRLEKRAEAQVAEKVAGEVAGEVAGKVEDAVGETWDQQDWDGLRAAATDVMRRAYAPYSRYQVGAAARADDGRVVVGCNVENAAYGVVLCAECGVVSQLHATGGGRLTHFVCVNSEGEIIMPCGRCRQLLFEHGGRDLLVWTVSGVKPMSEVLPDAFGPDDLAHVADTAVEGTQ